MRFGIIGAGAIGCLLAALLAKSHNDVILITRRGGVARAIRRRGLRIIKKGNTEKVNLECTTNVDVISECEAVLLAVKSYDTNEVARSIKPYLESNGVLVTLQNGLGNIEAIESVLPRYTLVGGSTTIGALLLGDGEVLWSGGGPTVIGEYRRLPSSRVKNLARIFTESGVPTDVTSNLQRVLWTKALINAGINPVTALLKITNGELLEDKEASLIATKAVQEGSKVANIEGIRFRTDLVQEMLNVAKQTAANKSSMLQDVENHRETEIDAINGAIATRGKKHSIPTPVNMALWALIRSLNSSNKLSPSIKVPA